MEPKAVILLGLLTSILAVLLSKIKSEFSSMCIMVGGIIIFCSVAGETAPIIDFIQDLWDRSTLDEETLLLLLKIIGMCILTEFTVSVCKDHGHDVLVTGVTLFCRVAVLTMALPVFKKFLSALEAILG